MKIQEFLAYLFEVEINAHIYHLQTKSIAEHLATDELYKGVVGLRDALAEAYQGQFGIITGYTGVKVKEGIDIRVYLNACIKDCKEFRSTLTEGYLQQLVDNIIEFFYGILYKLRFLS